MCIYLGNSDNLTYKNQEHIFPAGLGGIRMLDPGVVSDQANELFSPLELKLMRQSLRAIDRMMFGPGKRGSFSPQKASKSLVNVGLQDDGQPVLCYMALSKPYYIPQFHLHENEARVSVPDEHGDTEKPFRDFLNSLEKFNGKFVYLGSDRVPQGDILIGFFEGTYYVATATGRPDVAKIQEEITKLIEHFGIKEVHRGEHHTEQSHRIEENPDIARRYAQVAMNTLAFLKGQNYVEHPNFDEIRRWIVTGASEKEFSFLPQIQVEPLTGAMRIIPDKAHWCIFVCFNGFLEAVVSFYNHVVRRFTLGELPDGNSFTLDGYICDWMNKKEYSIMQLVDVIAHERHNRLY